MLSFFGSGRNSFVGIDLGTSSVKVVELSYKKDRIYLENYGWVDTGLNPKVETSNREVYSNFDQRLRAYLQKLVKALNVEKKQAFISIPGYNGLINLIDLPFMKKEDLDRAIQFEARKYIPSSLDEVVLSWDVILREEGGQKRFQVVLMAAPKNEVIKYQNLVKEAGLNTNVIELEIFSLVRSLIGDDNGSHIIIDMGARATNMILYDKNVLRLSRSIDTGGYDVTTTIADNLNVSRSRAESLKKEKGDLLGDKDFSLIIPSLELIVNEAKRVINTYKTVRVDSIILSGGTAKLKGIDDYFTKHTGIKTVLGDPWRKIIIRPELEKIVKEELGSAYAVAVGLALRGTEDYARK